MGQSKGYVDVPLTPQQRKRPEETFVDVPVQAQQQPSGGGVGTFVSRAAERLNPVAMAQGFGRIVIPEVAARAMGADDAEAEQYGPVNAIQNMGASVQEVYQQAKDAYDRGDYGSAAIKALFGSIPLIGPDLNQMGDNMRDGNYAEALGDATGLGVSLVAPQIAAGVKPAVNATKAKIATIADEGATTRTVDTMVPKIGPNKRKFGNMAVDAAPKVARETSSLTRGGMLDEVGAKLEDANAALEAAYDAVPKARRYATQPIVDGLDVAIKNLSVSGAGGSVEPATRAARLASLKKARAEVVALGGVTDLDNLRRLRQSWDEGAKAVFTPDIAADAMQIKNAGHGWADARSVVGDYIGSKHPELKPLNADVSLWIKARDVMQAAEEIERVRPTVGRSIMARGLGAAAGGAGGGVPGAIAGAITGPLVERWIANAAPAMKITVARQMANLADALRSGNQAKAATLISSLNKMVPAASATTAAQTTPMAMPKAAEKTREGQR